MNGMMGTSASAGCTPPKNSAAHDRPPPTSTYGQKLFVPRRFSHQAAPSAGIISTAKLTSDSGALG